MKKERDKENIRKEERKTKERMRIKERKKTSYYLQGLHHKSC